MNKKIWRRIYRSAVSGVVIILAVSLMAFSSTPDRGITDLATRSALSENIGLNSPQKAQRLKNGGDSPLELPTVRLIMFWMNGCPHCHEVLENVLPPLQEKYGAQLEVRLIEVVSTDDVKYLHTVAKSFGIPLDQANVPFIIIGDHVLIGSQQIPEQLPGLIENYLAQGGLDWPVIPDRPAADAAESEEAPPDVRSNGFSIAIATLALMAAAVIYSLIALFVGKPPSLPVWSDWLFPVLTLIGLGVAGYLFYVEIQMVDAVCGPVGDCNSVQSSPYARLFGILPVGVLGVTGYIAILGAWMIKRWASGRRVALAALAVFGMALVGVIFSLYLTYLEPFVIKAVCMWCISSAVIMSLILLLSLPAAVDALNKLNLRRQPVRTVRKSYVKKKT
jgi:uncharacterized membrane protein/glutaredoxin